MPGHIYPSLKHAECSFAGANDGTIDFIKCLETNTALIELDMSWNNISNEILQSIEQAIISRANQPT